MPFQSVPNTASFVARFTGPNNTSYSFSLYSRDNVGPWDLAALLERATSLHDAILADYIPVLSNEFTFHNVTGRDVEVEFGAVTQTVDANAAGGQVSPGLPAHVAVVGTFRGTAGAAPRNGRIYFLPPTESQTVGSLLTGQGQGDLELALESMSDAMSAGNDAHVLVSRYQGTSLQPGPGGQTLRKPTKRATAVTNTVADRLVKGRVDSQRKRRPREVG